MLIEKVFARWVLDSRGNPTIQTFVKTKTFQASAIVPSGASKGLHEALELRDNGKAFHGLGVSKAVKNVNTIIAKKLKNTPLEQKMVDEALIKLDGTPNKSFLGANAVLSVSLAVARLIASIKNQPLYEHISNLWKDLTGHVHKHSMPKPMANLINGGKHAPNDLVFQEFLIIPNYNSFEKNAQAVIEVYQELKNVIKEKLGVKCNLCIGDEGGFAPNIQAPEQALDLLQIALQDSGHKKKVSLGLDVAASEFYNNKKYFLNNNLMSCEQLINYYLDLIQDYDLASIEDPFEQDHFSAWSLFMQLLNKKNKKLQVVGDDLLVTNPKRINLAISYGLANALLLKPNQIGTLTEALQAAFIAKKAGWNVIVSHRSGDSEDAFIADLAVGIGASQIKLGAPCRGERTAKYNRLLNIEQEL
ncbi:phosphopyruvate hydratase [Candidatus Woesearchaeota archaeon]|nr:phosphopyruvate hydratase [Candidatus Woesearchaeota archaeon]